MQPLYFGPSDKPLLGVYQPAIDHSSDHGVVICYPMGSEYYQSYPAFRSLAQLLTRAEMHVFRFDFYGTGDSSGSSGEGGIEQWCRDIAAAVEELKATASIRRVSLVGMRLGAALAVLAALGKNGDQIAVEKMVLWEPVVNGRTYLAELAALQAEYLERILPKPRAAIRNTREREVLGTTLPGHLSRAIESIDLLTLPSPVKRIFITEQPQSNEGRRVADHFKREVEDLVYRQIECNPFWIKDGEQEGSPIPTQLLAEIVAWLKGDA